MPVASHDRRDGFTLIELLVVIAIIGILLSLILVAAADGVRRAEERQTQTLITKLEAALTDRVDALLSSTPPINQTHRYLAAITFSNPSGSGQFDPIVNSEVRRAQVIAQFDFMKAELPDVFYVNNSFLGQYPLNFAGLPYPMSSSPGLPDFVLPLGNRTPGLPYTIPPPTPPTPAYNHPTPGFDPTTGFNTFNVSATNIPSLQTVAQDSGIFGASFGAAAGVYKNLYEAAALDVTKANPGSSVYAKAGYDGADNNNDGLIDNLPEVTVTGATQAQFQAAVVARLALHTHKTARSEALYGILVEGLGPLGSVFNPEDFTSRDVADTDGDGMPEFIDAWGEPLQFYRWPIYYGAAVGTSDSQRNFQPYGVNANTPRQLDSLDPNQQVVSFAWWSANPQLPGMVQNGTQPDFSATLNVNGIDGSKIYGSSPASQQANAFMTYFHITIDPMAATPPSATALSPNWDRTGTSRRRAYYSKFLVLSAGPDKEPGVFQLNKDYTSLVNDNNPLTTALAASGPFPAAFPTTSTVLNSLLLNWCESQAAQADGTSAKANSDGSGRTGAFYEQFVAPGGSAAYNTTDYLQNNAGLDDITNHTLTGPGSGAK